MPRDPVWVSTTDAVALLFLPPALSLVHPALYLLASIFVLLTPVRNSTSLLAAPPSLSSPQRQQRRRPAQRRSHEGTVTGGRQAAGHPVRVVVVPAAKGRGGGGKGTEHSALSLPGSRRHAWLFPCRHHHRRGLCGGGVPPAAVDGHVGSDERGSGCGDNDMFCCCGVVGYVVFLVWWWCELLSIIIWVGCEWIIFLLSQKVL
jgi:hypothetical protein